jgi:hypothetical protein
MEFVMPNKSIREMQEFQHIRANNECEQQFHQSVNVISIHNVRIPNHQEKEAKSLVLSSTNHIPNGG